MTVYFHNEPAEKVKAQIVFDAATRAVEPLAALFGKYFYPADVNNRKLAFYVCRDRDEYRRLSGSNNPYGVACASLLFSPSGTICRGIYFTPDAFPPARGLFSRGIDEAQARQTIWHEMAHYVYFSSLDLSRPLDPPQWVTEGIAEYLSGNTDRLREADARNIIPLREFETERFKGKWTSAAYWIGYTAFLHCEDRHSVASVRHFLQLNYRNPTRFAIEQATGIAFDRFDQEWQESVKQRDTSK